MGTFKNLLSIQSLKIPFIGFVIVPVMCIFLILNIFGKVRTGKTSLKNEGIGEGDSSEGFYYSETTSDTLNNQS